MNDDAHQPDAFDVVAFNRSAWDRQAEENNEWTVPVSHDEIEAARSGDLTIILTPTIAVPDDWIHPLSDRDVLCLAGGGGQQAPLLSAAGANVTTLDNSPLQLERDAMVAKREGLKIRTVLGIMSDLSTFEDASFDLVVHPSSNGFAPDVLPVWKEAFRVLRPGGQLISGFNNPVRFLFDVAQYEKGKMIVANELPYADHLSLDEETKRRFIHDHEPMAFGHTLTDQIGGQVDAGFMITGFFEDDWGGRIDDPLSKYMKSFIATRATKPMEN